MLVYIIYIPTKDNTIRMKFKTISEEKARLFCKLNYRIGAWYESKYI